MRTKRISGHGVSQFSQNEKLTFLINMNGNGFTGPANKYTAP